MNTITHTCEYCGTRFEYPENISKLIGRYLIKIGYSETVWPTCSVYKKDGLRDICIFTELGLVAFNVSIRNIALNENRTPQSVLFDITYDNTSYLRGQLAIFEGFLAETTECDWLNKIQIEARIERLEQELAEELAKETEL